jgi:polysaccharide export outer membrane protein
MLPLLKHLPKVLLIFLIGTSMTSCKLREKLVYLQDNSADSLATIGQNMTYVPVLRTDDLLLIQVGGQDQEALAAFQFYSSSANQMNNAQNTQVTASITYLIDQNGNINFPVLGFVKLAGLTRLEATVKLQELISAYVEAPVVNIQLKNFRVTVLGQVKNPGSFVLNSERATILDALGLAGDLDLSAIRKNILVIREISGKRIEYRLDLTKKDVYESPAFFLAQNDVIYVEPNGGARFQGQNLQNYTQVLTPLISIFLSLYTIISIN